MKTKIFKEHQIEEAVSLLRNGEIVAVPTETVYGLAADATNDEAIKKIFAAKGRPSNHPLILHIDSCDKLRHWVEEIPENAVKIAEAFWPGPLTMIFRKRQFVSKLITGGLNTVAVRIPNHPIALEVIKKLGNPLVAPSANSFKRTSPTKPEHVLKTLEGKIAAIIDGGESSIGIESTIIDMTSDNPLILRPGAITAPMIKSKIGIEVTHPLKHNKKVSGNMEVHYQPEKPLFILCKSDMERRILEEDNVAIMHYSQFAKCNKLKFYKMSAEKTKYAKKLYDMLYFIDSTNVEKILVEKPPCSIEWEDINDRLTKASRK